MRFSGYEEWTLSDNGLIARCSATSTPRTTHVSSPAASPMGSLIVSTQMTLDGVIDVGDWYVAEGEHDRAGKEQLAHASAVLLGRRRMRVLLPTGRR